MGLKYRLLFSVAVIASLSSIYAIVGAERSRKVLVLGVDGLRPDAMELAITPNIDSLIAHGYYSNQGQSEDLTFSGPNWSSILHGVHRDRHLVTSNGYEGNELHRYPDFLALLESFNSKLVTGRLSTWDQLHFKQPTGADVNLFYDYDKDDGDTKITKAAVEWISGAHATLKNDPDVLFVYLADVDVAGHDHGFHPSVKDYLKEIEETDGKIGQILSAVKNRKTYKDEEWLIVLTSDHGGAIDGVHHGNTPEKRTVPFIVSGASVNKSHRWENPRTVDVAKTVLAYMNAPISKQLDGKAVAVTAPKPLPKGLGKNLLVNGDGEADRGFMAESFDQYVSGWSDPGPKQITTLVYGAPEGFPAKTETGDNNFFCGGQSDISEMKQLIDLSWAKDQDLNFQLSAELGGYEDQEDHAYVTATFLDSDNKKLESFRVGPVTAAERDNQTGLWLRELSEKLPEGSKRVEIRLTAIRKGGEANDGYADNIHFSLHAAEARAE